MFHYLHVSWHWQCMTFESSSQLSHGRLDWSFLLQTEKQTVCWMCAVLLWCPVSWSHFIDTGSHRACSEAQTTKHERESLPGEAHTPNCSFYTRLHYIRQAWCNNGLQIQHVLVFTRHVFLLNSNWKMKGLSKVRNGDVTETGCGGENVWQKTLYSAVCIQFSFWKHN